MHPDLTRWQKDMVRLLLRPEPVRVIITHRNDNPNTIWNRLAERLGREPTNQEATDEVKRILAEGRAER